MPTTWYLGSNFQATCVVLGLNSDRSLGPPAGSSAAPDDPLATEHSVAAVDAGSVAPATAVDPVEPAVCGLQPVVAWASKQSVASPPSFESVVASAAAEAIRPRPTHQQVVTGISGEPIVARNPAPAVIPEQAVVVVAAR